MRSVQPDLAHADEAAALAARFAEVMGGDTVVHTDIRDDNLLLCADGRVLLCDWNWPVRGAAWLDSVFLMIGPRGDGLDVEAALAAHPLTAELPPEHIDIVLALVTAFFLKNGRRPGAADLTAHPRPPALAGRGVLGLAQRAARMASVPVSRSPICRTCGTWASPLTTTE